MAAVKRNKRIFVSDIHMGDARSLNPGEGMHPYCWLKADHAGMFADFLEKKMADPAVKQIIILGDLFDEWVCPAELNPVPQPGGSLEQYKKVAQAPQNVRAVENLKKIAAGDDIELLYVPGNHDMTMTKEIMTEIIPGIVYLSDEKGHGVFCEDDIAAEHGNAYCLFNAPDTESNKGHMLPVGYFVTRSVAEGTAKTGKHLDTMDILREGVHNLLKREKLGAAIVNSVSEAYGLTPQSEIKMNGIDSYGDTIKIEEVDTLFGDIYNNWEKFNPGNVSNEEALFDDAGMLYAAAVSQYFLKKKKPDIVIFGHTHHHVIHSIILPKYKKKAKTLLSHLVPSKHIYANSGTWINHEKICTYVETEIDKKADKHYVRVMQYTPEGEMVVLNERYKNI